MRKSWPASIAIAVSLAGCGGGQPRTPALAEAWVGPAELKLRNDIPLKSGVAATVRHGERVEIVQRRRRFLRVRTEGGALGWTDTDSLLSQQEIEALRELAGRARRMPSQGAATTFADLNVHTLPARRAPSFARLREGDRMEVLAHVVTPRVEPERPPLIPPPPRKAPVARNRKRREPVLPLPAPPPPPKDWLELSRTNLPEPPPEQPEPVPSDDWSLVRFPSGRAGWVLTSRLYMSIPDEVAQYAEGHRITSYFSLGEVQDGDRKKHHWLWTTIGRGLQDYDFDSFRVFIWNTRRHRYETAYIERRLKGYFPVELHPVSGAQGRGSTTYPGFSVCVEKEDGRVYRRSFAFVVNVVRPAGEGPCILPPSPLHTEKPKEKEPGTLVAGGEPPAGPMTVYGRVVTRIGDLARRWLGSRQ